MPIDYKQLKKDALAGDYTAVRAQFLENPEERVRRYIILQIRDAIIKNKAFQKGTLPYAYQAILNNLLTMPIVYEQLEKDALAGKVDQVLKKLLQESTEPVDSGQLARIKKAVEASQEAAISADSLHPAYQVILYFLTTPPVRLKEKKPSSVRPRRLYAFFDDGAADNFAVTFARHHFLKKVNDKYWRVKKRLQSNSPSGQLFRTIMERFSFMEAISIDGYSARSVALALMECLRSGTVFPRISFTIGNTLIMCTPEPHLDMRANFRVTCMGLTEQHFTYAARGGDSMVYRLIHKYCDDDPRRTAVLAALCRERMQSIAPFTSDCFNPELQIRLEGEDPYAEKPDTEGDLKRAIHFLNTYNFIRVIKAIATRLDRKAGDGSTAYREDTDQDRNIRLPVAYVEALSTMLLEIEAVPFQDVIGSGENEEGDTALPFGGPYGLLTDGTPSSAALDPKLHKIDQICEHTRKTVVTNQADQFDCPPVASHLLLWGRRIQEELLKDHYGHDASSDEDYSDEDYSDDEANWPPARTMIVESAAGAMVVEAGHEDPDEPATGGMDVEPGTPPAAGPAARF